MPTAPTSEELFESKFSVDAALLRELGERLVGKPHIALAELVKNSYDADAHRVTITVDPDAIEVADNGHGMTFDEFERFWMRIGSPHRKTKHNLASWGVVSQVQRASAGCRFSFWHENCA